MISAIFRQKTYVLGYITFLNYFYKKKIIFYTFLSIVF